WDGAIVKISDGVLEYTDYGMSLEAMLQLQMTKSNPQTDKYRNEPRYIHADFVDLQTQKVTGNRVNVRTGPSTSSTVTQQVNAGTSVLVIKKTGDWVEVRMTWQNAKESDVLPYLDPNNFKPDSQPFYQFLKLSRPAYVNANEINTKVLVGKGILEGKASAFITAALTYNINEIYLISHSLLETGNGKSKLATGVTYNGKTVYNMFGYGAKDSCPIECGAKTAYDNG